MLSSLLFEVGGNNEGWTIYLNITINMLGVAWYILLSVDILINYVVYADNHVFDINCGYILAFLFLSISLISTTVASISRALSSFRQPDYYFQASIPYIYDENIGCYTFNFDWSVFGKMDKTVFTSSMVSISSVCLLAHSG